MIVTAPMMLLGLLTLPLLAAVYWFRRRSRSLVVSSLVLWRDERRPREGGRMLHRMQTPLAFFLELLAIGLLVVAAAGPAMVRRQTARTLVVVLDDSYSMLAEGAGRPSPRRAAQAALAEEFRRENYLVRLILAGAEPRLLGPPQQTPDEAQPLLAAWTCQSPGADLPRAMGLAGEVGGANARILVLTDQAPPRAIRGGAVQWWAFGTKLPNLAFTAAVRSASGEQQRALLEVSNLSDSPGRTVLSIEGGNLSAPKRIPCELAAGAARQFFLDLPSGAAAVQARLEEDALAIDNQVWLLPDPTPPVRVRLDLADGALRAAVARAVRATGMALEVAARPDLVVCDRSAAADGDAWRLEITGGAATAYAGPFVLDRTHPLAHGLSLEGIVWAAAPTAQLSGTALVTAGNVTLLSDREDNSGRRRLQMNFAPGLSNLQDMPDWPILFDNLLRWRRGAHPGAAVANVRLGQTVTVTLGEDVRQVELLPPAPPARTLDVHGRRVEVPADRTGLYAVKTPGATYSFACNAISRDESDLSAARTGRWGDWNGSPLHRDRQIRMRWMFLLLGMACLAAHLVVIAENSRSDTP